MAVRRSRSGPPWKVLRLAVPRGKRTRSGVVALAMLWMEATGLRWLLGDTATLLSQGGGGGSRVKVRALKPQDDPLTRSLVLFQLLLLCGLTLKVKGHCNL